MLEALTAAASLSSATPLTALVISCLAALPLQISMIAIGAKYKDECPVEPSIPIYLIVAGAGGLVANCCSYGTRYQDGAEGEERCVNAILQLVVQPFIFACFVYGNVLIYRNRQPNYADPESAYYCNKTLYLFAFWATNSYYIIFVLVLTRVCVVGFITVRMICFARKE
ncbi:uncharacterized protein LOC110057373 isoform X2 [Orbicella faveolata]|uniref:uncharacterized protein LOC110057362 isoform X2 n=1 Tax=Orbicella faveolata TaxID=48498 RepID=UPI0009E1F525|nr:uncharacterized protein LOC110057362 isoform X2 [Orbicella faveolata]XP_020619617.1 uncharacterized protein LOC110057373 isoform X2 [Orbicella faveolata]